MRWAEVWHRRSALVYTVGAWTAFGYVAYSCSGFLGKGPEDQEQPAGNETGSTISEDGLKETVVYRTPGRGFSVVTTTVYKPNFVPYTTRFQNYVQSFFDGSDSKGK